MVTGLIWLWESVMTTLVVPPTVVDADVGEKPRIGAGTVKVVCAVMNR